MQVKECLPFWEAWTFFEEITRIADMLQYTCRSGDWRCLDHCSPSVWITCLQLSFLEMISRKLRKFLHTLSNSKMNLFQSLGFGMLLHSSCVHSISKSSSYMLLGITFKSTEEHLVIEILKIVFIVLLMKDRINKIKVIKKWFDFVKLCQAYEEQAYG